jgi:hypothetical protein
MIFRQFFALVLLLKMDTKSSLNELYFANSHLCYCGLYYKHITIVNDNSSVVNKLETSLNDAARVVIYDCHMFIVQAIGFS